MYKPGSTTKAHLLSSTSRFVPSSPARLSTYWNSLGRPLPRLPLSTCMQAQQFASQKGRPRDGLLRPTLMAFSSSIHQHILCSSRVTLSAVHNMHQVPPPMPALTHLLPRP